MPAGNYLGWGIHLSPMFPALAGKSRLGMPCGEGMGGPPGFKW
jgi:hypothetical protein